MRSRIFVKQRRVPILGLPSELAGLKIAHVSDMHFRAWCPVLAQAQQLLVDLRYDLLAVTGDFADQPEHWRDTAGYCHRFFEPLKPRLGVYGVLGNHDDRRLAYVADLPLTWLNDESTVLQDDRLLLAGVRQDAGGGGGISRALAGSSDERAVILLAHFPSTAYDLPGGRVQLQLSGHTHGGQIRFPVLGALWTNDRLPRRMARGLHLVGKTWLHVNPGLGLSGPLRVRFRCPPEITVLELCKVKRSVRRQTPQDQRVPVRAFTGQTPLAAKR